MIEAGFVNRLRVGGTVLAARADKPSLIAWPARAEHFLVSKGADIDVTVRRTGEPHEPGELLFDSEGVWRAYRQPDGRLLITFRVGRTIYKSLLIDPEITRGEIFFPKPKGPGSSPRSAMQFPLDEMLFQQRWARDGQLEVHSFGVIDRSGVLVFTGHSGAGKSTSARLWNQYEPGRTILSDDRVLLDPRDPAGVMAHGTPWHGMGRFSSTARGRLSTLFFLEQAKTTEAVRLHPAEAAARLFTRTFPPIWDREVTERVINTCGQIAESTPAFLLRFRKDESSIREARRAAAGAR